MNGHRIMDASAHTRNVQPGKHVIAPRYPHDVQVPDVLVPGYDLRHPNAIQRLQQISVAFCGHPPPGSWASSVEKPVGEIELEVCRLS